MKFSANIGFLYTELPLPERIRAAKRDGFDAVECHFPYDVPEAEMKAALDETGFAMLGLNTVPGDVAGGDFGLAALAGRRDEAAAAVKQAVDYGAAIGAQNVHVMAGRTDGGAAAEAAYRETLSLACELAGEKGMGVLIEPINHRDVAGYHLSRVEHAAEIIEALGKDNLRIMFDCYHTQIMQGDLLMRFKAHQPLVGHVQIAAVPDRGEPDGGEICFERLLAGFAEAGWAAPVGAEYKPRGGDTKAGLGWLAPLRAALN
ncbi:isomerase [Salipiger sp. CCB-MM3]|uniref:hydroxypyruvate isomerase family protein n=1 Tax=Salipiger sp. CCB-MM3 TaxID=1792508 RepID=UPI00080AAE72|nr:TIM barrel protein [Salipiger sp. CCB-MM3]ANT60808.1 isomerase [Salipiger sp. CCB-MM3]